MQNYTDLHTVKHKRTELSINNLNISNGDINSNKSINNQNSQKIINRKICQYFLLNQVFSEFS